MSWFLFDTIPSRGHSVTETNNMFKTNPHNLVTINS